MYQHLTDAQLFCEAEFCAREARYWRGQATAVPADQARRHQAYARQFETRVFNLSIVAEVRCAREAMSTQRAS
jgi:hypothetical protein